MNLNVSQIRFKQIIVSSNHSSAILSLSNPSISNISLSRSSFSSPWTILFYVMKHKAYSSVTQLTEDRTIDKVHLTFILQISSEWSLHWTVTIRLNSSCSLFTERGHNFQESNWIYQNGMRCRLIFILKLPVLEFFFRTIHRCYRNRVGTGLSYRPARKRFLGSLKVYKFRLWS